MRYRPENHRNQTRSARPLKFRPTRYEGLVDVWVGVEPAPVDLAAVRDRQKAAIRRAMAAGAVTTRAIAEAVDEPVITVRLRLREMGLPVVDEPPTGEPRPRGKRIEWLRGAS